MTGPAHGTGNGLPNAPAYREFRMAADWASALRDASLHFDYERNTGRFRLNRLATDRPPVRTPPNAVRPVLASVEITFEGAKNPLVLKGDECSALLWGESAVEKFIFPYYASAAADDAARFLERLGDAWYGYPGRVVHVCALAFRYGTGADAGELSLDATVGLVCLERESGKLRMMSLGDFVNTYPTGAARGTVPSPDRSDELPVECDPWSVGEGIGSIAVREAAEFVSGMRGRYVWLTMDKGELTPWVADSESPGKKPGGTIFAEGVTPRVRSDRPAPQTVSLRVEGRTSYEIVPPGADPTTAPDSVFWTDGSVEKLVLPYYASVKGREAPFYTCLLMGKWDGVIDAASNDPQCAVDALQQLIPGSAAGREGTSDVFAVTHLPRSEYVSEMAATRSSPALERRTRLLAVGPEGFADHAVFGDPAAPPKG